MTEDADTLLRGLIETSQVVEFMLRRRISIRRNGKKMATGGTNQPKPPTTELRALLYSAHLALEHERLYIAMKTTKGLKRHASKIGNRAEIDKTIKLAEQAIGSEWMAMLRATKSYPGINGADLANSLGVAYRRSRILYRVWSWRTHAADSPTFAEAMSPTGTTLSMSPNPDPANALFFAATLYFGILECIDNRLRIGLAGKLKGFKARIIANRPA